MRRKVREPGLRPCADMLDDFGSSERAQSRAGYIIRAAREAGKETRCEKVSGARGVNQLLDRECRHRVRLLTRNDDGPLLRTRHDAEYLSDLKALIAVCKSAV